jgi:type II secretory pathway pseudopilin PulG
MSLLELTVVILVLLTLVGSLLMAAQGWKNGTDRARCVMIIRQMQLSVRAYSSANSHPPGTDLRLESPPINLLAELVGPADYVPALPTCPGTGLFFFGGDIVPVQGALYMRCSLAQSSGHQPKDHANW